MKRSEAIEKMADLLWSLDVDDDNIDKWAELFLGFCEKELGMLPPMTSLYQVTQWDKE